LDQDPSNGKVLVLIFQLILLHRGLSFLLLRLLLFHLLLTEPFVTPGFLQIVTLSLSKGDLSSIKLRQAQSDNGSSIELINIYRIKAADFKTHSTLNTLIIQDVVGLTFFTNNCFNRTFLNTQSASAADFIIY